MDKTKNEISDLDFDIQSARKKIYQLEATKQANEDANLGRAVDTIVSANLKGVHAPLMKLGQVDEEYSTAMEIAVGGRMAHIVVDDEHVASTCIELLKSANAGRATFIPLNKIVKCPRSLNLPKDKGVIDFAINLIDFDDEYLNAFYYAVGDTLVVEDREVAHKLIGKYRMVTLSGDLFEKSGSITGGAVRKTGLKFSQNSDSELDSFKAKLKEMEGKKNKTPFLNLSFIIKVNNKKEFSDKTSDKYYERPYTMDEIYGLYGEKIGKIIFVVEDVEIADHVLVMDIGAAEGHSLVENGQSVTHCSVSLLGDDVQRLVVDGDVLLGGDVAEVLHDVGYADAVEVVGLAAGQDRRKDLMLLRGGKDEDGVCRRLLQSLEESVECRL